MGFILFVGVGLGFAAAIVATILLSGRFIAAMAPKAPESARQRLAIVKGAVAGAAIAFVPALLLSTVIGATLGGTYGSALAEGSGARDSGTLAGVALGVFAVATVLLVGSTWLGAWVGRRIATGGGG